ncbi:UDP-N-acetylmuramate--L-alanine ligase, partial [Spirochaetota bacterium]
PEAEYVLNENLPYLSMAGALNRFFLQGKEVIAVSGTHGKSTTTALLAHILETAGLSPSFFLGGSANNFNSNYKLGVGRHFVIEADEYDSAFFEKFPKFIYYKPNHLIITSLEFDHADIYNNIDEIELWFKRLVNIVPSNGNIIYSAEYPGIRNVLSKSMSNTLTYGKGGSDFSYAFKGYHDDFSKVTFNGDNCDFEIETGLFGDFNYQNITGAVSMALKLGIDKESMGNAVKTFKGVKRRQEVIFRKDNVIVYEDFAHHPTSVNGVINSMKERHGDAFIWAVYEPRSATSRRNIFQDELSHSFSGADRVIIKSPYKIDKIESDKRLDMDRLKSDFDEMGRRIDVFDDIGKIIELVENEIDVSQKNVIVIMSNGGFDGIYESMEKSLNSLIS